jgi:hypothetical protein
MNYQLVDYTIIENFECNYEDSVYGYIAERDINHNACWKLAQGDVKGTITYKVRIAEEDAIFILLLFPGVTVSRDILQTN